MDYPKHLSEKIREEVALSYLKHELRKIFPSIDKKEIENLMKSRELCNPRDFWNALHGISMGFKLKNILYLVTAENVIWSQEKMNIEELTFGVELSCTRIIREGKLPAKDFINYYDRNSDKKSEQLRETIKIRGNDSERENDPIIVIKNKDVNSVYDGNGRLARKLLEGGKMINVFMGKMVGDTLTNYWLPTSLLMDNLYYVYEAIRNNDEGLLNSQMIVINNMLKNSESGRIEFEERALSSKPEIREKVLHLISR